MSEFNTIKLHGTLKVSKSYPANGQKQALCYARIRVTGEKSSIDVTAFGAAAEAMGNADGLTVDLFGHVSHRKPSVQKPNNNDVPLVKEAWPLQIVIEAVKEYEPRGKAAAPAGDDW